MRCYICDGEMRKVKKDVETTNQTVYNLVKSGRCLPPRSGGSGASPGPRSSKSWKERPRVTEGRRAWPHGGPAGKKSLPMMPR